MPEGEVGVLDERRRDGVAQTVLVAQQRVDADPVVPRGGGRGRQREAPAVRRPHDRPHALSTLPAAVGSLRRRHNALRSLMREIGTLVPSTAESVAGSDFGLPGFVPRSSRWSADDGGGDDRSADDSGGDDEPTDEADAPEGEDACTRILPSRRPTSST